MSTVAVTFGSWCLGGLCPKPVKSCFIGLLFQGNGGAFPLEMGKRGEGGGGGGEEIDR